MRVAVAGGTGVVGRHIVEALTTRGHQPVVLSRGRGVDVGTGTGLAAALADVDVIVDVSNIATSKRSVAEDFFARSTAHLLAAGVPLVVLSIIGIDRVPLGYYRGKQKQEQVALDSGRATVLRTTQFHDFAAQILDRTSVGQIALVPRMRSQPIAAREVAVALADLVAEAPQGRVPDLAGPQPEEMTDLVRRYVRATRQRRWVVPVTVPGAAGRAMRNGGALPAGPGARGSQTFDAWLAEQR
jgi:uncharacterized protein YbjT (DUF2867 family)